MDTRAKPELGFPVYFDPGELTLINRRHDPELTQAFYDMMSRKALKAIGRQHLVGMEEQVDIIRVDSPKKMRKYWGIIIEFLYRIRGERGSYRHVFHLVLDNGDSSGRLFTQSRRFTAK